CPTNGIFAERTSATQILEEAARKCKEQEHVYLQCKKQSSNLPSASSVTVPCLGAIPRDAWLTLLNKYGNLSIYHYESNCQNCEIATGYDVWQKELRAAEEMAGVTIAMTTTVQQNKKSANYDVNR